MKTEIEKKAAQVSSPLDPPENLEQLKLFYLTSQREETEVLPVAVDTLLPALLFPRMQVHADAPDAAAGRIAPIHLLKTVATNVWRKKTENFGEELRRLINTLQDMLQSFEEKPAGRTSEEDLRSAFGDPAGNELNMEAFSNLLEESGFASRMSELRIERIGQTLGVLRSMSPLYIADGVDPAEGEQQTWPPLPFITSVATSVRDLREQYTENWKQMLIFFEALKIARLEAANRYDEEIHDAFFARYGKQILSPGELLLVPPVLVHLSAAALSAAEKAEIIQLCASGLPFKILFQVDNLFEDRSSADPFDFWAVQLGRIAANLGGSYVLQAPYFSENLLVDSFFEGIDAPGPALFSIYTAGSSVDEHPDTRLLSSAAMEARIFPAFTCNPRGGADLAGRFDIGHTAAKDQAWPTGELTYLSADEVETQTTLPFTAADFLLLSPALGAHFWPLSADRWHEKLLPLGEFLSLSAELRREHLPYLLAIGENGVAWRVLPGKRIVEVTEKIAAGWKFLQELGGIGNSHARHALEVEKARLQQQMEEKVAESVAKLEAKVSVDAAKVKEEAVFKILGGLLGAATAAGEDAPKETAGR